MKMAEALRVIKEAECDPEYQKSLEEWNANWMMLSKFGKYTAAPVLQTSPSELNVSVNTERELKK